MNIPVTQDFFNLIDLLKDTKCVLFTDETHTLDKLRIAKFDNETAIYERIIQDIKTIREDDHESYTYVYLQNNHYNIETFGGMKNHDNINYYVFGYNTNIINELL